MVRLLAKLTVHGDLTQEQLRQKYGMLCGAVGIFFNILLFVLKFTAGHLSGSVAITADGFNNLSDSGSSVITMAGFRLAGQKPDREHPFGHGRVEYLTGLIVSILIIVVGVELIKSSITDIITPEPIEISALSYASLCVSIAVKLYMYVYNHGYGKKFDSSALRATAADSRNDCVTTGVVLISTVLSAFSSFNFDAWCGLLVAAFIIYSGIKAAKDTIDPLLGQMPTQEFVGKVEKIVMRHKLILGIHDLVVHDYGPGRRMISLHAEVPADGNILDMHDTIDNIEHDLQNELGCEAVIHMDPIDNKSEKYIEMNDTVRKLVKEIRPDLTIHDFRIVTGPTHTNLIFDLVIPYAVKEKGRESDDEIKKTICDAISKLDGNYFAVISVDHSYAK